MKIEEILKMADVSEIHNFVKLYLVENSKLNAVNFKIFNYVSKDSFRPALSGVYHKNGHQIATDGIILVGIISNYPEEYEGKIIDNKGRELEYKYVDYEKVIPKSNCTIVNLDENLIKDNYKRYKVEKKAKEEFNKYYKMKIGEFYYNIEYLYLKVLPFYDRMYGLCETSEIGILKITNDLGERLVLYPIREV